MTGNVLQFPPPVKAPPAPDPRETYERELERVEKAAAALRAAIAMRDALDATRERIRRDTACE